MLFENMNTTAMYFLLTFILEMMVMMMMIIFFRKVLFDSAAFLKETSFHPIEFQNAIDGRGPLAVFVLFNKQVRLINLISVLFYFIINSIVLEA